MGVHEEYNLYNVLLLISLSIRVWHILVLCVVCTLLLSVCIAIDVTVAGYNKKTWAVGGVPSTMYIHGGLAFARMTGVFGWDGKGKGFL